MERTKLRKYTFVGYDIDLADVYSFAKSLLQSCGFYVRSEIRQEAFLDLQARTLRDESHSVGKVRDVDLIVTGHKTKFEVQLHAGVWGRDLAVACIESVATLGVLAAMEVHSAHRLEDELWEQIVHQIDPHLKVCPSDGLVFKTDEKFAEHSKIHEEELLAAENIMMGRMRAAGVYAAMEIDSDGARGGPWIPALASAEASYSKTPQKRRHNSISSRY
jgi:hypothetical protein